jgi:pimeloyl-ACP methyl ester carboxylesterase
MTSEPAGKETIQASISAPLNPYNPLDGRFDLYYFVEKAKIGDSRKTILFIVGGPGEFLMPAEKSFVDFLPDYEYNVVYFHLRGAGFSQIPPQADYDKFLTTAYAVEDIEEIRQDLIRRKLLNEEGKWDAIIAWSYGTVLAQQYTFAHQDKVDKLILFGPLSRHNVASAGRQFRDQAQNILRDTLEKIYNNPVRYDDKIPDARQKEFSDLTKDQKEKIFSSLFGGTDERGVFDPGVIARTESAFGSINFVIDRYSDLQKKGELHRYNLHQFSCGFFAQLYRLRFFGWIGNQTAINEQVAIGAKIRDEIIHPMKVGKDDCSKAEPSSARVSYAMGTLDGINIRFLREWLANGRRDVRDALRKSAGDAHVKRGVNEYVEKLGIGDDDMIGPSPDALGSPTKTEWDPANYKHGRPTLILKGEADPVTVGDQAEYFHSEALLGPRILIPFPGIGHEFALPETRFQQSLDGMINLEAMRFSPAQVAEVKGAINGLRLNRHLNLRLLPPHDLEPGLRLVGFGRVAGKDPEGLGKDIIALIQNTSGKKVPASKRVWKLESEFFSGKVEIDPGTFEAGQTKPKWGKITDPRQKEGYRVRVSPPNDWDIKVLCAQVSKSTLSIMLLSQGNISAEGKLGRWTIYNDYFSIDPMFKALARNNIITAPFVEKEAQELLPVEARWNLSGIEACLPDSEELSRVLAQRVQCDLPVVVQQSTKPEWKIDDNDMFTATISSRLESCMPDGDPLVVKGVATLTLKNWIEITEPPTSESKGDFDLLGYNILDQGRISLVLRNGDRSNSKSVGDKGRDWFYQLIGYRPGAIKPPCGVGSTTSCLIYSYLVMDPVQFNDTGRNVILLDIIGRFNSENQKILPRPLFGGIQIPGRTPVR